MTRQPRALAAFSILLAALACISLDASLIIPASLQELAVEAQAIVVGRVTEVRAQARPGRRRIDTYVVFAVDEAIKGAAGPTVMFKTLGGVSGRYRTVVPGSPVFAPGDEAVLFLGRGAVPYPIGLSHGVFRVRRDRVTGERRVLPPPMLLDPSGALTVRTRRGARVPIAVDSFLNMVRRAAKAQR
jgi:hypothetical protein